MSGDGGGSLTEMHETAMNCGERRWRWMVDIDDGGWTQMHKTAVDSDWTEMVVNGDEQRWRWMVDRDAQDAMDSDGQRWWCMLYKDG